MTARSRLAPVAVKEYETAPVETGPRAARDMTSEDASYNHDFDFGQPGSASQIDVAAKAGRFPPVVASNTHFAGTDTTPADLQRLAKDGVMLRRHQHG